MKKLLSIFLAISVAFALCSCSEKVPEAYTQGLELYASGEYKKAISCFESCIDYKNSSELALESKYQYAGQQLEKKEYFNAKFAYQQLAEINYKDSSEKVELVEKQKSYDKALEYLDEQNYASAYKYFDEVASYLDSQDYLNRFSVLSLLRVVNLVSTDNLGNTSRTSESYTYDSNGRLSFVYSPSGILFSESPLIYAWQYNPFSIHISNAEIYTYNEKGQVEKINGLYNSYLYGSSDLPLGQNAYIAELSYNDDGRLIEEHITTTNDEGILTLAYNQENLVYTVKQDNSSTPSLTFYYDSYGNVVEVINTVTWYIDYTFSNVYDENGILTERTEYDNGEKKLTAQYKYSDSGNLIESYITYTDSTTTYTYTYSYSVVYVFN